MVVNQGTEKQARAKARYGDQRPTSVTYCCQPGRVAERLDSPQNDATAGKQALNMTVQIQTIAANAVWSLPSHDSAALT